MKFETCLLISLIEFCVTCVSCLHTAAFTSQLQQDTYTYIYIIQLRCSLYIMNQLPVISFIVNTQGVFTNV